jgi:hypothetical protein
MIDSYISMVKKYVLWPTFVTYDSQRILENEKSAQWPFDHQELR